MRAHNLNKTLRHGSYISKHYVWKNISFALVCVTLPLLSFYVGQNRTELVSPMPDVIVYAQTSVKTVKEFNADESSVYVDEAVREFIPSANRSEAKMILHCLLNRESRHGDSGKKDSAHGDNGKAGGPMQFWEESWTRMRSKMAKQGYSVDDSDRYSLKESIRTTAWAMQFGQPTEWGPILRSTKGSNFAACQYPSWRK